jgi:hypothetical protein
MVHDLCISFQRVDGTLVEECILDKGLFMAECGRMLFCDRPRSQSMRTACCGTLCQFLIRLIEDHLLQGATRMLIDDDGQDEASCR